MNDQGAGPGKGPGLQGGVVVRHQDRGELRHRRIGKADGVAGADGLTAGLQLNTEALDVGTDEAGAEAGPGSRTDGKGHVVLHVTVAAEGDLHLFLIVDAVDFAGNDVVTEVDEDSVVAVDGALGGLDQGAGDGDSGGVALGDGQGVAGGHEQEQADSRNGGGTFKGHHSSFAALAAAAAGSDFGTTTLPALQVLPEQ